MENINLETFPSGNVLLLIEDAILVEKIKALLSLTPLSVVGQTQDIAEAWKLLVEAKPVLALLDESQISLAKAIKSFSSEISIMLVHSEGRETFEKTPYLDSVICESNLDSFFGELATLFEADNSLPKWVYI